MLLLVSAALGACADGDGDATGAGRTTTTVLARPTTTVAPLPPSTVAIPEGATITQPAQPVSGPGSSALPHRDWEVSAGGEGADAWYVFEPASPRPRTAPLVIALHGYYEFEGYVTQHEFIRHTVLSGSVVVYPRWQTGELEPCPGPFDIEPCMDSALAGINGALDFLEANPQRVQPDLDRTSYFGHSFGGILTANLLNRWEEVDLPEPRAVFLEDIHDSALNGPGEPSLDDSMDGIPSATLLVCHVGAEGVISQHPDGSCNALFPKLDHIPDDHKALVLTRTDEHGEPRLSSSHGVCGARPGTADAYDWNFCWRVWDHLRAAADAEDPADRTLGDLDADNGSWSDGTPIAPLEIRRAAPIRP